MSTLTQLNDVTYLGSHPHAMGALEDLDLIFTTDGLRFTRGDATLGEIAWPRVISLSADARDTVDRRITAPRVLFLGVFSIFLRKTQRFASLNVCDADGVWIFAVGGISASELRAGLVDLQPYVGGGRPPINRQRRPARSA